MRRDLWSPALVAFSSGVIGSWLAIAIGKENLPLALLMGASLMALVALGLRYRSVRGFERILHELRNAARGERISSPSSSGLDRDSSASAREVLLTIQRQRSILEAEQASSREILDGFGEGLLAIDRSKRVVLSNRRFREMFGLADPSEGELYYEVVRHTEILRCFDRALEGEHTVGRAEIRPGGEERLIELRVTPFEDGGEIAVVGLFIDVSSIERLGRIRSEFISDFSHEVRTPLTAMQSAVETLESGFGSDEQRAQLLKILSRQIQRLEQLSFDLADLDRIESGEVALNLEQTDIGNLVDDVVSDFADRGAAAGIWVVGRGEPVVAEVDPVRIEQVLTNLIDNALKHAPGSDRIVIETRRGDETFELRVSDRGPGVPLEEQQRIFNRFFRADKSRSAAAGGAGLGLAIAKHLVRRHGGSISVDSEPGEGATFVVTLPYRQE